MRGVNMNAADKEIHILQLKILAKLSGRMETSSWWENGRKINIHVTPDGEVTEHGGITYICCVINYTLGSLRDKRSAIPSFYLLVFV